MSRVDDQPTVADELVEVANLLRSMGYSTAEVIRRSHELRRELIRDRRELQA